MTAASRPTGDLPLSSFPFLPSYRLPPTSSLLRRAEQRATRTKSTLTPAMTSNAPAGRKRRTNQDSAKERPATLSRTRGGVRTSTDQYRPVQTSTVPVQYQYRPVQNQTSTDQYRPVQNQYRPVQYQYRPVQNQYRPVQNQYRPVQTSTEPVLALTLTHGQRARTRAGTELEPELEPELELS